MKKIYILLTRSKSLPSFLVSSLTGDSYTHSSISFDDNIHALYSFGRKYSRLPMPAGLIRENINRGFYRLQSKKIPCKVLCLEVDNTTYYRAKDIVHKMLVRSDEYKYNLLGAFSCKFKLPYETPTSFFCSQFVAEIIKRSGAAKLPKCPALMHPADFLDIPTAHCVFDGTLGELRKIAYTLRARDYIYSLNPPQPARSAED